MYEARFGRGVSVRSHIVTRDVCRGFMTGHQSVKRKKKNLEMGKGQKTNRKTFGEMIKLYYGIATLLPSEEFASSYIMWTELVFITKR